MDKVEIEVFRTPIISDSEWKQIRGTPLAEQMVRNQFVISGLRHPSNYERLAEADPAEGQIDDYLSTNAKGLIHIEVIPMYDGGDIDSEGDLQSWIIHCELATDADEIMAWVKLKF